MKQENRSALIVAAVGGHASVVKLLLGAKANVNHADDVRYAFFDHALLDGQFDIERLTIVSCIFDDNGSDVMVIDEIHDTGHNCMRVV